MKKLFSPLWHWLRLTTCRVAKCYPCSSNSSSAVVSENNYEYIGEVRGAVKAVGNAKDFNGAVNYSNTSRPISVNFGVLGGLNERNLLKWHFFCNFAAHNSA